MNPDDDIAAHAGRLAVTTTWYGAYLVLCAVSDHDLEALAEALEADHGPNVGSFLARAAHANADTRAAAFLAVEDHDPDLPALRCRPGGPPVGTNRDLGAGSGRPNL